MMSWTWGFSAACSAVMPRGQVGRQGARVVLDLLAHALVDLERVDFEIELVELDQAVDAVGEDSLEEALAGPSPRVRGHHARHGRVGAQQGRVVGRVVELVGQDGLRRRWLAGGGAGRGRGACKTTGVWWTG